MPVGASEIPDLRLSRINKLVTSFTSAPNLVLSKMFGTSRADSDTIKWESQVGTRGVSPFMAPGTKTPQTEPLGVASHSAVAAFWGEKMFMDEHFLNNLRKMGTESTYLTSQQRLAGELQRIRYRIDRRKEWMFAKMLSVGSFDYLEKGGNKLAVSYDIPTDHNVTLGTNYKWGTGNSADILSDIRDAKIKIKDDTDMNVNFCITTQTVLRYMVENSAILELFQADHFNKTGVLGSDASNQLGIRPQVIGQLLDIPNFMVYDERFTAKAWLTANVTASSTTVISVTNVEDFEVGGTLRFNDTSAGTWEDETISAIGVEAGTVTVSSAPSTSYKAGEDTVTMTKTFIPNDVIVFGTTSVDGQAIAEFMEAPFGNARHYGPTATVWEETDPEGVYIRVQNKGLPILTFPESLYILNVE